MLWSPVVGGLEARSVSLSQPRLTKRPTKRPKTCAETGLESTAQAVRGRARLDLSRDERARASRPRGDCVRARLGEVFWTSSIVTRCPPFAADTLAADTLA